MEYCVRRNLFLIYRSMTEVIKTYLWSAIMKLIVYNDTNIKFNGILRALNRTLSVLHFNDLTGDKENEHLQKPFRRRSTSSSPEIYLLSSISTYFVHFLSFLFFSHPYLCPSTAMQQMNNLGSKLKSNQKLEKMWCKIFKFYNILTQSE